jgi:hypothetical protein
MPEQPSPVLTGVSWAQCTCKPCKARRAKERPEPGCSCKECQPGEGVDYGLNRNNRAKVRRERLKVLLQREDLNKTEEQELDDLLHLYIHSG